MSGAAARPAAPAGPDEREELPGEQHIRRVEEAAGMADRIVTDMQALAMDLARTGRGMVREARAAAPPRPSGAREPSDEAVYAGWRARYPREPNPGWKDDRDFLASLRAMLSAAYAVDFPAALVPSPASGTPWTEAETEAALNTIAEAMETTSHDSEDSSDAAIAILAALSRAGALRASAVPPARTQETP